MDDKNTLPADDGRKQVIKRRVISIVSLIVMAVIFVLIALFIGKPLIQMLQNPQEFRAWIDSKGPWSRLIFIGIMCLQVVIAVIPGEPIEIAAGYSFGAIQGMLICLVGAAVSSAIVFGFTKLWGIKMVEAFVSREKIQSLKFIKDSKRLDLLIFILFFIPGSPKDLLTYFIGLTPMKLRTFLLISTVARIPSVITSTIGGNALGLENYKFAIIVFIVTGVISLIGIVVYNRISAHHTKMDKQKEAEQAKIDN